MAHEGIEKNSTEPSVTGRLTPERAAEIAAQHQSPGNPLRPLQESQHSRDILHGFEVVQASDSKLGLVNRGQIDDCSKDKCVVNGKQYTDSTEIPGNRPKPPNTPNTKPVIGPDGNPIVGPDRIDLEQIAKEATDHRNWLSTPTAVFNFRHNGIWDFQRMMTDDIPGVGARPIFTQQYQNFANVGIGYVLGSLGMSLSEIAGYGNTYCRWNCSYSEPMSKQFPYLAERQMKDFEIGLNLYKERHPDGKK